MTRDYGYDHLNELDQLLRDNWRQRLEHPSVDEIMGFFSELATEPKHKTVRYHLASCSECRYNLVRIIGGRDAYLNWLCAQLLHDIFHPDAGDLALYSEGFFDPGERRSWIESHLNECAHCHGRLERMKKIVGEIRDDNPRS